MKKILALLSFAVLVVAGVNAQKMTLDKEVHDYGKIKQYDNGTCKFLVTNEGNEPLVISRCQGSCGCTVPECPTVPIAPGQSKEITVKYDTKRTGTIAKSVTIYSNDPDQPQKVIRIKGFIEAAPKPATSPVGGSNGPQN